MLCQNRSSLTGYLPYPPKVTHQHAGEQSPALIRGRWFIKAVSEAIESVIASRL